MSNKLQHLPIYENIIFKAFSQKYKQIKKRKEKKTTLSSLMDPIRPLSLPLPPYWSESTYHLFACRPPPSIYGEHCVWMV